MADIDVIKNQRAAIRVVDDICLIPGPTGAPGEKGDKGDIGLPGKDGKDGFSPTVAVKTDTEEEYVLTISDKNGNFDTPNLKGGGGKGDGTVQSVNKTYPNMVGDVFLYGKIPAGTVVVSETVTITQNSGQVGTFFTVFNKNAFVPFSTYSVVLNGTEYLGSTRGETISGETGSFPMLGFKATENGDSVGTVLYTDAGGAILFFDNSGFAVGDTVTVEITLTSDYVKKISSEHLETSGLGGMSAYEVALKNGFEGTEQEWLESLIGPQGPQGVSGVYVGSGEMPEGYNVQIDPNGNPSGGGTGGVTFIPSVSADGVISWTNNGGLDNPTPVNIKGADGKDGQDGKNGQDGAQGEKGDKGDKGDPYTPTEADVAQIVSLVLAELTDASEVGM